MTFACTDLQHDDYMLTVYSSSTLSTCTRQQMSFYCKPEPSYLFCLPVPYLSSIHPSIHLFIYLNHLSISSTWTHRYLFFSMMYVSYHICYFGIKVMTDLACGCPFQVPPTSFGYASVIFLLSRLTRCSTSPLNLPCPSLESTITPRNPDSFWWGMLLEAKVWVRLTHCYWGILTLPLSLCNSNILARAKNIPPRLPPTHTYCYLKIMLWFLSTGSPKEHLEYHLRAGWLHPW